MTDHDTYNDYTNAQRRAVSYAVNAAERGEHEARMSQAEAFCNGNDDIAERYDGPSGYIAHHADARRELMALLDLAYGVTS